MIQISKQILICSSSVMVLASCGGGNEVASGTGAGVTSASAVTAGASNSAASTSVTSAASVAPTKAAMDKIGTICSPPAPAPACQNFSCLPNPPFGPPIITPASVLSGTIYFDTNPLPPVFGSTNYTAIDLSTVKIADLLISNYVAGALLGRLVSEQYPGVVFSRDYLYGTLLAQLLNENEAPASPTPYYDNSTNWINPLSTRYSVMGGPTAATPGTGGPYQINNYGIRNAVGGLGLVNYTALQQGLGYTMEQQDANCQYYPALTPDSMDSKYFGPLAAAYYSFNDIFAAKQYQDPNSAPINICLKNLNQANITAQSANNIFDVLLSTLYNSGITSSITTRIEAICAAISPSPSPTQLAALQALVDYTLNPTLYSAATGISSSIDVQHFDYARDARFTLDQLYNQVPTTKLPGFVNNRSVSLNAQDIATVFANAFGTLSYVNSAGKYGYIASEDSTKAFAAALTTTGLTMGSFLNISNSPTDRAKFFDLLDAAIINLEKSLINSNFTGFNATTQSTLPGMPTAAPQINPALTK